MNIFISYTTRNNEVTKNALISISNKLKLFGNVFIDLLHNNSIDKQERIVTELKNSDLLILIKSASTLNSEWVRFELETVKKINIPIIELSIEEVEQITFIEIKEKLEKYRKT